MSESRLGPSLSTKMKETPLWHKHFTLQNQPTPPSLEEQRQWVASPEYKQQIKKPSNSNIEKVGVEELRRIGATTLSKLAQKESQSKHNQMSTAWTQKMLHSGTLADKISALSLQIKYQPLSFAQYFDSLLALAARKGHKETNLALETLRDLFMTDIIPLNRKLRFFHEQPWVKAFSSYTEMPNKSTIPPLHQFRSEPRADLLALFYLEDYIKKSYGRYIETISDQLGTANMIHIKNHRVKLVFELLAKIPEQENNLLVLIINKFGDSDRAIVSKVQFHLERLVKFAPALKLSVIKEIERVIFRPHIKQRTQYFAILFITNLMLDKNDLQLAQYLLTMYLTLFQIIVNDALPLVNDRQLATQAFIEKNKQYLSKTSRGKKAEMAKKKAKALNKHKDGGISTKILGAILTGVARCLPYALPSETHGLPEHLKTQEQKAVETVLVAQIDQLIHCAASTAQTNGNVCVQSLALIWQIISVVQATGASGTKQQKNGEHNTLSRDPFYRVLYSVVQFPQPFTCSRVKIFFNVLFKSLKADDSKVRVLAIIKRLLQTAMTVSIQATASVLYIVSNVAETHQFIYNAVQSIDKQTELQKQDIMTSLQYNQYLQNIAREEKELEALGRKNGSTDSLKSQYDFALINPEKIKVNDTDCWKVTKVRKQQYDPFEGDPLYSRADSAGLFELCLVASHFHPTLQVWANNFFNGELIQYGGDPIKDFTPIAFLDNWLRKQSKRADITDANVHQPKRLIVDPEIESYIADAKNNFIQQFVPLYKNRQEQFPATKRKYRETEEDFADSLVEEELLRIGGRGKEDQFDYEDFDDFADEIGEGETVWDDRIAFGEGEIGGLDGFDDFGEFQQHDDEDYDDDEDDLYDDEDDSDFDESQLVSLDWDSLDPSKATIDEISESEEEPVRPAKKSIFAERAPAKATTKQSLAKQQPKDIFGDLEVSDLDDNSDQDHDGDMSGNESGDDEEGGDLRDILDDDEAVAEMLEEVVTTSKRDVHAEKMISVGLGGKATRGSAAKRKQAPISSKTDRNTHQKSQKGGSQNKRQKTR